ncbi:flagellar basal body protein FliL, partial [Sphingomonas sp. CFBP 13714]|nr:flagellar basal body protein FliL [Sphingomonas sp. CFBP 13714]
MSEKSEAPVPKKKGKMGKMIIGGVALLVLVGGGVGAGVYASSAGLIGGGHAAADDGKPKLIPKSEQKSAGAEGDGEGGGHGGGEDA